MHFDDRLGTVLRFRADSAPRARAQYRQLLDLIGTLPSEARSPQIDAAQVRMTELEAEISAVERAAMLLDPALRLRSPRLVAALGAQEPEVAAAALARAQLDTEQWLDLIPALPPGARGHVRQRHDLGPTIDAVLARLGVHDRALPPADVAAEDEYLLEAVADLPRTASPLEGIGAIVRKIEAFRRSRQDGEADAPRLPLGEEHVIDVPARLRAFDFASDAAGRIVWADPGAAPMATGLTLAAQDSTSAITAGQALAVTMRRRQPVRGALLSIDGAPAIAGRWQLDAAPWFDPLTGAFCGYRGRMRRPAETESAAAPAQTDSQSDRIRQLLHELRTPVNAIQGFAEIIQQQLFGPSPHEYRALAATIAGDAARMLAAFEELERLARLDSGAQEIEAGTADLMAIVLATVEQLGAFSQPRGSGFTLRVDDPALPVSIAPLEVERIAWRLLATMAGTSAPGEQLKLRLRQRGNEVRLTVALPTALASKSDAELFSAAPGTVPQAISAGVFGVGFALRLAGAEARTAGGSLERREGKLRLTLPAATTPGLTAPAPAHSESADSRGNSQF